MASEGDHRRVERLRLRAFVEQLEGRLHVRSGARDSPGSRGILYRQSSLSICRTERCGVFRDLFARRFRGTTFDQRQSRHRG